jgi:hypothetical protein
LISENAGNLECIYITLSINGQTTENANLEMHGVIDACVGRQYKRRSNK